jgi:hypothetical protein
MNKIPQWLLLLTILGQTSAYADRIHDAADSGDLPTVMKLIELDNSVVIAIDQGFTALMHAARKGHLEVIKALLTAQANVDAQHNTRGLTAIMYAAINGHHEIVKVLLEHKARIDLATSNGQTVISKANPKCLFPKNMRIFNALRQYSLECGIKFSNPKEIIILDRTDKGSYERDFAAYIILRKEAIKEATGIVGGPESILYQYLGEE